MSESKTPNDQSNPIVDFFRTAIGTNLGDVEGAPPSSRWLNGKLLEADPGRLKMEFTVRPEMSNPTGLLHGGFSALIMDDLIGATSATLNEEGFLLSIDLHVNFLGKAQVGEKVTAEAKILRNGKRIAHAECIIWNKEGQVVSRGDANLVKTSYKPDYRKQLDSAQ